MCTVINIVENYADVNYVQAAATMYFSVFSGSLAIFH